MFQIRDNIHGDITLEGMFANIVNTPEFQRLRCIEQGDFRTVFPGARHDRFVHSLGAYHLATKFVEGFFRNLPKDVLNIAPYDDDVECLKTTFRYAALLHDLGHAPFSHTTEKFYEEVPSSNPKLPLIWQQLCDEIQAVAPDADYQRFVQSTKKKKGAAHEIMSAILLIRNRNRFIPEDQIENVDLELAARMVIGYTYAPTDKGAAPGEGEKMGLRNCLIQLLNFGILDIDRLDYLCRDTMMSGFTNAALDLETLASSVTAVKLENGWLAPAYRDSALRVFDLMFQAKLSHDAWVLANPAGRYNTALVIHCIRRLNDTIDPDYCNTIFSVDAMGQTGVDVAGKHYHLLSDIDVWADLKAQTGDEFKELFTRELSVRRTAVWRSYYEDCHIFGDRAKDVYKFFSPLLKYMEKLKFFTFDPITYGMILRTCNDSAVRNAAKFLNEYLLEETESKEPYSIVLLDRDTAFTMSFDPADIRIVFPATNIPLRDGEFTYSTYSALTGVTKNSIHKEDYFYIFRRGGLGHHQLSCFRRKLLTLLSEVNTNDE